MLPVKSLHLPFISERLGSGLPRLRRGFPEFKQLYISNFFESTQIFL